MANKDLEIKVKITPEITENFNTSQNLLNNIEKAGGFKGSRASQKVKADGLISQIKSFHEKSELTEKEFATLTKLTNNLNKIIQTAATKIEGFSEGLEKLVEENQALNEKLQDLKSQRAELFSKGKTGKGKGEFVSLSNSIDILREIAPRKLTKENKLSKNIFTDFDTIRKNGVENYWYQNKETGAIEKLADHPLYQQMISEIDSLNIELESFDKAINEITKSIQKNKEKIAIEAAKTKISGEKQIKGFDLVNQATNLVDESSSGFNDVKENINKTKGDLTSTNSIVGDLDKTSSSMGKLIKQVSFAAIVWRTFKKAANEAVKTIKDIDKYLTEQAMVTGRTREETYALLKTYQDMGAQIGATTKEVAEVSTQFLRQGKTVQESLTLTRAAISAAKVASIDASKSVDYLTTALNGFQLSADKAMLVSDKFASVAASAAVSYEEVAVALSKVAAQANLAGMSIDYTTALLTKGIETTRGICGII